MTTWTPETTPAPLTEEQVVPIELVGSVIETSSGFQAFVPSDLYDHPSQPDANWALATGDNVGTTMVLSTALLLPELDDPDLGGLALRNPQRFDVAVRRQNPTGTNPTAQIILFSLTSGPLKVSPVFSITSNDFQTISLDWLLSDIADIEDATIRVEGFRTGGGPAARNTVEVGAVRWFSNQVEIVEVDVWTPQATASTAWSAVATPSTTWTPEAT